VNNDAVQAKWFRLFISWLTSSNSLEETAKTCGVSTRTLQRRFTPFWLIQPPRRVDKQRIYDQIFIDGTYFNTKCLVVAADSTHVINWFWCTKESSWSYMRPLDPLAPPQLVTCDGDAGGLKALHHLWPDTPVNAALSTSSAISNVPPAFIPPRRWAKHYDGFPLNYSPLTT